MSYVNGTLGLQEERILEGAQEDSHGGEAVCLPALRLQVDAKDGTLPTQEEVEDMSWKHVESFGVYDVHELTGRCRTALKGPSQIVRIWGEKLRPPACSR